MNTLSEVVKITCRAVVWTGLTVIVGTVMFLSVWAYCFAFMGGA